MLRKFWTWLWEFWKFLKWLCTFWTWFEEPKPKEGFKQIYDDFLLHYGKHMLNSSMVYYFIPLMPGADEFFAPISMAGMQELLKDFKVVTHVKTWDPRYIKNQKTPDPKNQFPFQYYNSLIGEDARAGIYYNGGMELISITDGLNVPLMEELLLSDNCAIRNNSVCMYGYRSNPFEHPDFDTLKATLQPEACDVYMKYSEQEDDFDIEVAQGSLTTEYIIEVFQRICGEFQRTLAIDN